MSWLRLTVLIAVIAISASSQTAAMPVQGMVIDDTGTRIANARVTIRGLNSSASEFEVPSDANGFFQVDLVPGQRYHLQADKSGYIDVVGQTWQISKSRAPALSDVPPLKLLRLCTISGTVLSSDGKPMRGVHVIAVKRQQGELQVQNMAGTTDDQGHFRIFDLPPGRYTDAVVPRIKDVTDQGFTPTFYGGTTKAEEAIYFQLPPGSTEARTDFTLAETGQQTIAGVVSGIPRQFREMRFGVTLMFSAGNLFLETTATQTNSEGQFQFTNVSAGDYRITVTGPIVGIGPFGPITRGTAMKGFTDVTVTNEPVLNTVIPLLVPAPVEVHLASTTSMALDCSTVRISLVPSATFPNSSQFSGLLSKACHRTFKQVPSGEYRLMTSGFNGYLEKMVVSGRPTKLLDVDGPVTITLYVNDDFASIKGTVITAERQSAADCVVTVVPIDNGSKPTKEAPRQTRTDNQGRFDIEKLAPGKYIAIAGEKVLLDNYLDPASWHTIGARRVDVKGKTAMDVILVLPDK